MHNRDKFRFLLPLAILLTLLLSGACTPAESDLSAGEPWARAATAGMSMDDDAMTNTDAETDDTMTDSGDETAEPGMAAHSGAVSAAYMVISNRGSAADRLTSASTDAAGVVEIHTVEMEDGVMRMRPLVDGLEIPAGQDVSLEPGGYHIMLMDLQRDLVAGETLTLTLAFESGKSLTVAAEIRTP